MNYNQLKKIKQITDQTLIIGTDVSKSFHVSRAQDFRGIEFGKSIRFNNDIIGILEFEKWFKQLMIDNSKTEVIIGMEPTGHYWIPLARCLKKMGYKIVTVNPAATKKLRNLMTTISQKLIIEMQESLHSWLKTADIQSPIF